MAAEGKLCESLEGHAWCDPYGMWVPWPDAPTLTDPSDGCNSLSFDGSAWCATELYCVHGSPVDIPAFRAEHCQWLDGVGPVYVMSNAELDFIATRKAAAANAAQERRDREAERIAYFERQHGLDGLFDDSLSTDSDSDE